MGRIVANRTCVSERFPVASFAIQGERGRYYEVACATDPALFHTDNRHRRTEENFFTSRRGGLQPLGEGHSSFVLPPEQLRRFRGARRIFYALGTYGSPDGARPQFTIAPDALQEVPFLQLAADFTGRSLDRSRLRGVQQRPVAYGSAGLAWGGDEALLAERSAGRTPTPPPTNRVAYDDGYDSSFWTEDAYGQATGPLDDSNEYASSAQRADVAAEPPAAAADAGYGGMPSAEPAGIEHVGTTQHQPAYGRAVLSVEEPPGIEHAPPLYGGGLSEPRGDEHPRAIAYGAPSAEPEGLEHAPAVPTPRLGDPLAEPGGLEHPGSPRAAFGAVSTEPAGLEHVTVGVSPGNGWAPMGAPT